MKVSIIIPVYNEIKVLPNCLASLKKQTVPLEIIVVDDGSTDGSQNYASLHQKHLGPGAARNLGAKNAQGEILVFVDADMEFEPDFVQKLIQPIVDKKFIGTFSKDEYLLNENNPWARFWNLNLGRPAKQMLPIDYRDTQPVFRAVLKKDFDRVGGFDTSLGYTDDWSLSRKLNQQAVVAAGAKFYHRNPETLGEVWQQARWFGKNEFLTKNMMRKLFNLFRYFPLWSLRRIFNFSYFVFTFVYSSGVFTSVLFSFAGEQKYK